MRTVGGAVERGGQGTQCVSIQVISEGNKHSRWRIDSESCLAWNSHCGHICKAHSSRAEVFVEERVGEKKKIGIHFACTASTLVQALQTTAQLHVEYKAEGVSSGKVNHLLALCSFKGTVCKI